MKLISILGDLPEEAVPIGNEVTGDLLYSIKGFVGDAWSVGKYSVAHGKGYLPYDGVEHEIAEGNIEILCYRND